MVTLLSVELWLQNPQAMVLSVLCASSVVLVKVVRLPHGP